MWVTTGPSLVWMCEGDRARVPGKGKAQEVAGRPVEGERRRVASDCVTAAVGGPGRGGARERGEGARDSARTNK